MANLYQEADSNKRKTLFLMFGFFIFIILVGLIFSLVLDSFAILIVAVVLSILMSFGSYWYSDKLVLSMMKATPVDEKKDKELYRIVENLCITAGLPMPKIYIIEESQPNAFATGRNPKNSVVAVTRGLLEKLERSELEGVIAHELSHIGNRDMLLGTITVTLVGVVALLSNLFLRISFFGGLNRRSSSKGGGAIQLLFLVSALFAAILAPIAAKLIKLSISRKREFLADSSGALLTRYPEGLARALEKISQDSSPMRVANNSTAHLFIASPFRGKNNKFSKMFMTHPPVEERIKKLRKGAGVV